MSDMMDSPFERQNRIQAELAARVKLQNETGQSALQEKAGETLRPIWKYRKEMEEKYAGFPLMSDREYDSFDRIFGGIIESSAAPDELRDQIETSLVLSKVYGATLEDIWNNYDHYLEEWDTSYRPKTTARAILDSVRLTAESMNYNRLGIELKHRKNGFDMELMAKIEDSRRRMAELQDNVPRPWYIEAAKFTVNSLPLTAVSLAAGAVTGGVGTALGLSSAVRAGLTLLASAGSVHAMTVGGEYNDLIAQGVRHDIAAPLSEISSALQAVAEVALGNVGGVLAGGLGVKTVTGEITKRLFISGRLGAAGRALMEYAAEGFSEGAE
ncbi:MAG: hypothetical protein LBL20_02035, partial [Treponema sp.]|nr:hypothetical protein [Treponema sp.]